MCALISINQVPLKIQKEITQIKDHIQNSHLWALGIEDLSNLTGMT
jgi:hypothetical protein